MLPTQSKMKKGRLDITAYAWTLAIGFFFLLHGNLAFCQQKISGVVRSEDNLPVVAATIAIKNSNGATMSDKDGRFSISAKPGDVLEISFTGFKTQQIKIGTETVLKITLQTAVILLDELILTGYTSQKIKEITGSVAIVKPKDLRAVPAGQMEQMLQGRVAGLNIITSGEPGSSSNVRLHGIGNFGDVTPLYIIDGVEGNINSLNPYDIESLQVLKDAGAYSIYGVRGANGVILITTKKGKSGQTKISYDFYIGNVRPPKNKFNLLNPQENANLLWIALKNSGQVGSNGNPDHPLYGNGPAPVLPDFLFAGPYFGLSASDPRTNPDLYNIDPSAGPIYDIVAFNKSGTNWFNELFKPALKQSHNITVSGGRDKHQYLFSMGYLDEQGTYLNTYLKRYTARINTEFTLLNSIRIGENLQLEYSQNPRTGNWIGPIIFTDPYLPVKDIKGNWSSTNNAFAGAVSNPFAGNPLAMRIASKDDKDNNWQIFGNAYGEVDFLKKFTLRTSFGGPLIFYNSYNYAYGTYEPPPNGLINSSFSERSGYSRAYTWTNTLTYAGTFGNDHHIKVLAGTETKDSYNREQGGTRTGYFTNDPSYRFLSNGNPAGQRNYSLAGISYLSSFISQADYGYKEKYFVRAVLRRDGSSIFGPENRFGWFPAFSIAWRLTEENFMKSIEWLTDLKLRGSWGKTGFFGNTDPFNQYTLYGGGPASAYYDIFGTSNTIQPGIRALRIGNPKTGWQEDEVTNFGFESIFWNGRLTLTADYYNKKSKGLLFPATLPAILGGVTPPNVNVGNVRNKGIDLLVGSKGKLSKNWNWDLLATFTSYNNKIVKLNDLPYFDEFYAGGGTLVRNEVGYPVSSFYGYQIIGLFQDAADVSKSPGQDAAAPGRFKYSDVNGRDPITAKLTGKADGSITEDDRIHFGNPNPKFTLGLNIGINYKGFDFSTFLYGSFGNDVLNHIRYYTDMVSQNLSPKSKTALYDSWTPDNKNARVPVLENELNFSNASVPNTYILEKGTYLRNKTMILGYAFPKNLLQKIKVERFRIYAQAVNLFTVTKYRGLDPELSGSSSAYGIDVGNYPSQKQYLLGLNLGF